VSTGHGFDRTRRCPAGGFVGFGKNAFQLVHDDGPPQRAQAFGDPPVVDVTAGALADRARHDEVDGTAHQRSLVS
jgi:hypothetical protein